MRAVGTQVIQTQRLLLRPFERADAGQVFENYGSDEKVNRYIRFAPCASLKAAKAFIAMHLQQYRENDAFYGWAITLDGAVIGSIGLFDVDEDSEQCELGYSIGSRWWKQGYATEAAKAVLDYGFENIQAHRIFASYHVENVASGKVLARIGMKEEGILRDGQKNADGTFSDLCLCAKLCTDK